MRRSVRGRVVSLATALVVVVLVAAALGVLFEQRRALTNQIDESLRRQNNDIALLYRDGRLSGPITGQGDEDAFAQVVAADGRVVQSTANVAGQPAVVTSDLQGSMSVPWDDARYRVIARHDGDVVVVTAAALDDVDDSVTTLRRTLVPTIVLVAIVLALVMWWLVGRTLRPVEAIRAEVDEISGTSLNRRVPVPPTDDEIASLARTMNAMLERVEGAVERQRQFVADASHELRSPLTRIRSELEVDLDHPETANLAATHRSVLDETTHLQRLVNDLLELARSDAGAGVVRSEPVDLDDIVLREMERLRAEGRVEVDISGVSAAQVVGDRDQLTRALRNLTENAARHARSKVTFSVAEQNGVAEVTVTDDGPGIPPEQQARVFERFTRLDGARSADDGGAGLGLAIALEIAQRHRGSLRIDPDHSPGTRVVLRLARPDQAP